MEVLRLGVESELQLQAYAIATATLNPSRICDLCGSLWHCWILNPPSEARYQTLSISFLQKLCWGLNLLSHIKTHLFFIHSATMYILIGAFCPLTFKVIFDRYVFIAILNLCHFESVFLLCSFLFFLFLVWWFALTLCSYFLLFGFREFIVFLIFGYPLFQIC